MSFNQSTVKLALCLSKNGLKNPAIVSLSVLHARLKINIRITQKTNLHSA